MKARRSIGSRLALRTLVVLALGVFAACDNPVGNDDSHPVGVVLVDAQSGEEVASYSHLTTTVTGQVAVPAGGSRTVQVFFVSRGGDRIPVGGGEYSLAAPTVVTATFAGVAVEGTDRLRFTGNTVGNTSVVLPVRHSGHLEFTATIPLSVTP